MVERKVPINEQLRKMKLPQIENMRIWLAPFRRAIAEKKCYKLMFGIVEEEAHELMRGVPEDRASRDLQMAVEYLRSRKEVEKDRIASVGWCMGGGYSLQTALVVPDLTACVICYGRLVTEDATIDSLSAPILGIFGAEDRGIPPASVEQFDRQATELDKSVEMYLFDGAGHAFMNPNNKSGYNIAAADSAWKLIDGFLDRQLKPKKAGE